MIKFFKKRKINKQIVSLGHAQSCMPIDIFSLSRSVVDLGDIGYIDTLIKKFGNHENAFVRRCLLTAIRFSEQKPTETMSDYISRALHDPKSWVQYDAAFIIKTLGSTKIEDIDRLKELAGDYSRLGSAELDAIKPDDNAEYVKKMAAQALCSHNN